MPEGRFYSDNVVIDGRFVSQRVSQIVQAIKEYAPELDVEFIPEGSRKPGYAAYRIVYKAAGQEPYVVLTVQRDEDMNEGVLQRIIMADQNRPGGKRHISQLEAADAASKMIERQQWLDKMEEAHDMAASVLKSNKDVYKFSPDLIIKEGVPVNYAQSYKNKG